MRIGILAAVVLSSTIVLMPSALAQMTPEEHEGEPPPSAARVSPEPRAEMQDSSSGSMPGMMGREETMQGPSPGVSMGQMMRGPKSTEFYPTLIRISEPDPAERERLEQRAEQWRSDTI